ncbi:Bro-N domain-containing protein [Blautia sp. MSJ-36]|nr:Bro-N domain-containing protein [Blautia sp. MSJ-36]
MKVANTLGYQNGSRDINRHVDSEDKTLTPFQGGCSTGIQDTIIINESSLSSLIPLLPICLSALRPNRL